MTPSAAELSDRIAALMVRDQRPLRRNLGRATSQRDGDARGAALAQVAAAVEVAEARLARRRAVVPTPTYPENLPVSERKDEIAEAIRNHQVVIVAGETGSGKSTQLPKICLEVGLGVRGLIGHTQPRRLAARSVAERIADELGSEVGGVVGYAVRFTDRVGDDTLVKVMTDGILLNEIQRDRLLSRYETIIVDEAHERSLNIDFILGYLKQLLPQRPDLRVIVTSATIDTERFAQHFDGAPVVEVSGRTYPVDIRYRPIGDDVDDDTDVTRDQAQAICDAVVEIQREMPGDILVFLSGEREIRDTADVLSKMTLRDTELLPLYARLSATEQHRVFAPHPGRRIVLATNVAETSLTVPGIRAVVDPGTARISRYNRRTKVQRLPIEPVSQASANQRAGRCGRVGPGVCIRLYDEADFQARPEFTEPEILRTNLASVILQMTALGLGDIAAFPFVEPPESRNIKDGIALLEELGALDPSQTDPRRRLTPLGRKLAQLPLDPRLGRMVLEAHTNGCVREVMVIAAALSIQDPRERPSGKQQAAAEKHGRFTDPDSDFVTYLNLWRYLREKQRELSSNQFRKLCKTEFLNYLRVREWHDIYSQLREVAGGMDIRLNSEPGTPEMIHRSLLAGLLSHIGMKDPAKPEYLGARNARFAIAPGSSLFKKGTRWVMAAELVETNRLWARVTARVQPEWAERLAGHLVTRTYSEPHWDARRGAAVAFERVTLYGLPLVTSRVVDYARVDRACARDLFIRHALVEGDWVTHHAFFEDNRKLIEEIRALEHRVRRHDILVDEEALFEFYARRIPDDIVSTRHFDRWWKLERHKRPDLLRFTVETLVNETAGDVTADAYPDVWRQGDLALSLSYEFEPGSPSDGVTVHIPLPLLNRVHSSGFDWQVPGLRTELVTALIRSLPKQYRRNFAPAPDYARAFVGEASPDEGPLVDVLSRRLGRMTGDGVPVDAWDVGRLPDYLRMTFAVEDGDGRALAVGKDLDALRPELVGHLRDAVAEAGHGIERHDLQDWTIDTLPQVVETPWEGHTVVAYPALVDEGDSVAVRTFATRHEQAREMWAGTARLLLLTLSSPKKALQHRLTNQTKLALARTPGMNANAVIDDCVTCAVDRLMAEHGGPAWDAAGFASLRNLVKVKLVDTAARVLADVGRILSGVNTVEDRLSSLTAAPLQPAVADIRLQLARFVYPGFVASTGAHRLADVARYVQAAERRLDKLTQNPGRDAQLMRSIHDLEHQYDRLLDSLPPGHQAGDVGTVRWMIEELRVSYFAQQLGTPYPISEKRIRREMERIADEA